MWNKNVALSFVLEKGSFISLLINSW